MLCARQVRNERVPSYFAHHSVTATFRSFVPIRSPVVSDNRAATDVRAVVYHGSREISNENYFTD